LLELNIIANIIFGLSAVNANNPPLTSSILLGKSSCFIKLEPQFTSQKFTKFLKNTGAGKNLIAKIVERMTDLNQKISDDTKNLGKGYCIGHSYFCPLESKPDDDWYQSIIKSEIEPLLEEYWFDDPDKVESQIKRLLS
jgi:5-methylcytosine-specific restriction protein B